MSDDVDVCPVAPTAVDVARAMSPDHDPLAVSEHCPECGESEPECVCGSIAFSVAEEIDP